MKKIILASLLLMLSMSANADYWSDDHIYRDYFGNMYAAISYGCLHTRYTNNRTGSWHSEATGASIPYTKGCAKSVVDAFIGKIELPGKIDRPSNN